MNPTAPPIETTALRLIRGVAGFLRDWLPMFIVLFAYDAIHNFLGRWLPPSHTLPQIHVEQALFGATIPTIRLQQAWYAQSHPHWWDFTTLAVYMSHFIALAVIALVLWCRSRVRYLRFMTWFVGLTTFGFITYAVYPAVPPWLASLHGDLAPTHRIVRELWDYLGLHGIAVLFSGSNPTANDVAAIPSLHAAYPLMIALFFWNRGGLLMRAVLTLYTVIMAIALVYAAEHYVVDIALGWLYVVLTGFVLRRLWPLHAEPDQRNPAAYEFGRKIAGSVPRG